jgi:hypothetical protein
MDDYTSCGPDIIKSVRQRWLIGYWGRLRGGSGLPRWSDLDTQELESCFDDLSILDVVRGAGTLRFRIVDHGKNVGRMYAGECAGKFLDDVLPCAAREHTLETYERTVRAAEPIYTVSRIADAQQRPVLYERLLVPFGDSDARVGRIIAFLETISPAGAFQRQNLMTEPAAGGGFIVKAVVRTGARVAPV